MAYADWWPPYAYVPGQNARHPEGMFDALKGDVTDAATPQDLQHTTAFKAGLRFLEAGFFWECHEVLEAVWLEAPAGTAERELTQALIQLANARLKARMHKPRAVARLLDMVGAHLDACAPETQVLGLSVSAVRAWAGQKP